jgi:hypothetical protein
MTDPPRRKGVLLSKAEFETVRDDQFRAGFTAAKAKLARILDDPVAADIQDTDGAEVWARVARLAIAARENEA